jgi:hypothetical protein
MNEGHTFESFYSTCALAEDTSSSDLVIQLVLCKLIAITEERSSRMNYTFESGKGYREAAQRVYSTI